MANLNKPQFLYFVAHASNKDLLKEELRLFHPYLTPSFSKQGFLTYKNTQRKLNSFEIKHLQFAFALEWGESPEQLDEKFIQHKLELQNGQIELPKLAPSRAYLKIAEACQSFHIQPNPNENWIEFGSAPGGASFYLLQHFGKIIGVDPGEMDDSCLKHANFTHIKKPIQNIKEDELTFLPIHWITSDLNLNPHQVLKEVLRLAVKHQATLKGLLITIKMVKFEHVKLILVFERNLKKFGFTKIKKVQLPSHKREFLLYGQLN